MKRLTALLAALLLLAALPLAGCSRGDAAPEIDFDAELVGLKDGVPIRLPYSQLLDLYVQSQIPVNQQNGLGTPLIPCIVQFGNLLPAEKANRYCAPEMADCVFIYEAKVLYDFALDKETDADILYYQDGSLAYQTPIDPPYRPGEKSLPC